MDAFALAEQAEHTIGDVYGILSAYFAYDPDLRALFAMLEQEERAHARRVRELAGRWADKGAPWVPAMDVDRFRELLKELQAFKEKLEDADEIVPENAIKAAMRLEDSFGVAHAEAMAHERDPELRRLFAKLSEHDYGHRELLARSQRALRAAGAAKPESSGSPVESG